MESGEVTRPWYEENPGLVEQIERDLHEHYPTLRLDIRDGQAEVRGTFPVLDEGGVELDRWEISIVLPKRFPGELPFVRETGGRIPVRLDNHVVNDGTACVMLPEERYRWFPHGAPFRTYLDGPVRAYFTMQSYRARGGTWLHDEWAHGALAAVPFYMEILGCEELVAWRALVVMALGLRADQACPCGSGHVVGSCHAVLLDVRAHLGEGVAEARLLDALVARFKLTSRDIGVSFLRALRHRVKGHHACPCESGRRVRDCHESLRDLNGVFTGLLVPRKESAAR
jgi:hypothetical protein